MKPSLTQESQRQPAKPLFTPAPGLTWFRGARFWALPLAALALIGLVVLLLALAPVPIKTYVGSVGQIFFLISAVFGSLWVSVRSASRQQQWAWRCMGLAFGSWLVADVIYYSYLALTSQTMASPSLADLFYLLFYFLLAPGLLLLPAPLLTRTARAR